MGRVVGVYGVRGWVRVFSYTRPRAGILSYACWWLKREEEWRMLRVVAGRTHGKGLLAALEGVADRDGARALIGADIAVERKDLPALPSGQYYWCDLVGLEVVTTAGAILGRVASLAETGAHDVLVVRGEQEYLIPLVFGTYIKNVDLAKGAIRVDWEA